MMNTLRVGVCLLLLCTLCPVLCWNPHLEAAEKDDVVGAIWKFKATNGKETIEGQYRVYNYEVFKGAEKVGLVKPKDEDETTLVITGFPKLNGTTLLRKTKQKPPLWVGTLKHKNGSEFKITIDVKNR